MNILSTDHELTKMGVMRNTKIYKRHDLFLKGAHNLIKKLGLSPGQVTQLVRASSHTTKGCSFNHQSGHILKLWVPSSHGVRMGGN